MATRPVLACFAVALILGVPSVAQDSTSKNGRIEGEIRDPFGAPVAGATARLVPPGHSATSSSDGHFMIEDVTSGFSYTLVVEAPGYLMTIYSADGAKGSATPLVVQSGGVAKIKVVLPPAGSLSGKVADADGNPGKEMMVAAVRLVNGTAQYGIGSGNATSNEQGEFQVPKLAEGDYYLLVQPLGTPTSPSSNDRYVETYFPSSPDGAGAALLHVTGGVDLPGNIITLRKEKTFAVRGVVKNTVTGNPEAGVRFYASKEGASSVTQSVSGTDGAFTFPHLPPGTYAFQIPHGRQMVSGLSTPSGSFAAIQVEVRDSDVSDVLLSFQPDELITGKIVAEDGKPLAMGGATVTLQDRNPAGLGAQSEIKKDQSFEMRLSPSSYAAMVRLGDEGTGYFLSNIKLDGVDLKLSSPINIPPGGGNRLELVLSPHAGKIAGTVNDDDGKPLGGLMVLARPKVLKQGVYRSGVVMAQSNQDGKFQIVDVPPGEYYVTTVSDLTTMARNLDAFLDNIARKSYVREEVSVSEDSPAFVTLKVSR